MTTATIGRPPIAPPAAGADRPRRGPLLRLRLSDGASWAHEFDASSADDLRDQCFEAFVACSVEWHRRADLLPAHQTTRRAKVVQGRPRHLELHLRDPAAGAWVNASWAADPMRKLIVSEPGTAAGDTWRTAQWADAWFACLRTADAAHRLAVFLGQTVPAMLREGLADGDMAAV